MDKFTPEQQAVLASMPEALATQIIMEHAFKTPEPVAGVNVGGNLVNPYTGEVMYSGPEEPPTPYSDAAKVAADLRAGLITEEQAAAALAGGGDVPASFAALDMQAQAAGLVPGSPEYKEFMMNGGGSGAPAAFIALDLQAKAAGFVPGTPEYQEFMATRGAGLAAESRAIGEARGAATAGAPAEVQAADETLGFIDEVRKHPGLDQGTGASSVLNVIPGTSGYDFQNRVNQLLSGGFLTAIDQLRGMGALSNAEGQTATRAISRMDTATSKEEFLAALDDYERVVKEGRKRAEARLKAPAGEATPPPDAGLGLTEDDLKYLEAP
jgi:hypothetical protein